MGKVREKTLKELVDPDEDQRPLCIVIPPTTQPFELKQGLIHLLPIFKGKKRWLYYLEPGSITTWGSLKKKFLEKFFPASKANNIRKEIYGIRQAFGESLSRYWERFKELCASFPFLHISNPSLIQYFYSGLLSSDKNTVDAAAGGALADKTPIEAQELISRMAENSQSFGNRASELVNSLTKEVSEIKSQMLNMTTLLTSFVQGTPIKVTKCGVFGFVGHPNDKCPEVIEDVNIVQKYDPHGNTYNSGWRDNPNLRWGNDNQTHTQAPPTSSNQGTNLEVIIKALATNTFSFQQEMKQQITQLTTAISKMDGKGKLLAQPDHANVSAISLRSDAIQQVPRYAKFLKELCTNKRKIKERAMVSQNVSALLKSNIPEKCNDPGTELKTLPPHLKYIFLGKKNTFLAIISRELNQKQEERLIEVLKKKKQAIGWTLDDIKGISPTFCMHRMILEEEAKDKIQPQRRLNPTLKEIVMNEVLKLKNAGMIYSVPDSTCVSPIHVVPKKIEMTVVKNDKGEMVPMRMQNGWRMCIGYRKLNEVTKNCNDPTFRTKLSGSDKKNQTRPYGLHASFLPLVGLPFAVPLPEKLKKRKGEYKHTQ
ncbi:retrotransposon gag protein [Cucumis melo var. makuwa]|uniref:Retrotransposon gag protein n=1 Tax=Cucumis melo var. makuwa TaxID=1194695 RepID=A0A5A7ULC7_CUCMM|nr:retrotransposon gag protein [Cucumis melo var. makuwa]